MSPKKRAHEKVFPAQSYLSAVLALPQQVLASIDWSGKTYCKFSRSQGPDIDGIIHYSPLLKCLITLAPNGLPSLKSIRSGLKLLTSTSQVKVCSKKNQDLWLLEAAASQKLMCAHLREMRRQARGNLDLRVQELIDAIHLEDWVRMRSFSFEDCPIASATAHPPGQQHGQQGGYPDWDHLACSSGEDSGY